jgi:single-strand DNA-binding protein
MAGSYNKMVIIGNLGADPDMQYTQSGQAVSHFRVAVNERRPTADNQVQETTQWFRVTCWGELAESVTPQLHKGSLVYAEGSIQVNEFTGNDGQQRFSLDLRAREVRPLDARGSENVNSESADDEVQDVVTASPARSQSASKPPRPRQPEMTNGAHDEGVDVDDIPF